MVQRYEQMLARCEALTLARYEERGRMRRIGEGLARLLAPLM